MNPVGWPDKVLIKPNCELVRSVQQASRTNPSNQPIQPPTAPLLNKLTIIRQHSLSLDTDTEHSPIHPLCRVREACVDLNNVINEWANILFMVQIYHYHYTYIVSELLGCRWSRQATYYLYGVWVWATLCCPTVPTSSRRGAAGDAGVGRPKKGFPIITT